MDVYRAVASGSRKVSAIEINSIIANDIMRGRYADFTHRHYEIPEVDLHVGDGRSFIRSARHRYDVLQMTLVGTWAATSAGAFALSENNLYTVEAFTEYFQHLKPDGMVAITRWEFERPREALRVVSVAMEALKRLGVPSPADNFMVVADGPLGTGGRTVLVLAKRESFTADEKSLTARFLGERPGLMPLYLPGQPGGGKRRPHPDGCSFWRSRRSSPFTCRCSRDFFRRSSESIPSQSWRSAQHCSCPRGSSWEFRFQQGCRRWPGQARRQ